MKKVFGLFLSLIALMGLSACEPETPGNPQKPDPEDVPEEPSYLTLVSSGESTITLHSYGGPFFSVEMSLEYSFDGVVWKHYTNWETIKMADGEELMFRAEEQGNDFSHSFLILGNVAAKGNVMSLLDRSCRKNAVPANAFFNLFCDCTGLTEAPELPATELSEGCYTQMFKGCANLKKAPKLPAMELAKECYFNMFEGCTSLTETPALPATKLAEHCYWQMFSYCMSLTEAPKLPATELAEGCYAGMFGSCMFLTKAPELPATKLAEGCYEGMFTTCTSLTEAPVLPAKKLAKNCYSSMFSDCENLNYVKALFTDNPSRETTYNWLWGVARTGTFVKSKDATWRNVMYCGIPNGWTVETE